MDKNIQNVFNSNHCWMILWLNFIYCFIYRRWAIYKKLRSIPWNNSNCNWSRLFFTCRKVILIFKVEFCLYFMRCLPLGKKINKGVTVILFQAVFMFAVISSIWVTGSSPQIIEIITLLLKQLWVSATNTFINVIKKKTKKCDNSKKNLVSEHSNTFI